VVTQPFTELTGGSGRRRGEDHVGIDEGRGEQASRKSGLACQGLNTWGRREEGVTRASSHKVQDLELSLIPQQCTAVVLYLRMTMYA